MRVAIAGGGIAGLTAAIALAARGFEVQLFERAPELKESGAGIQLSPNATAVLERLGVMGDLAGRVSEPRALVIRDGRSGALLKSIPLGAEMRRRYGTPYCAMQRADLQAALLATARRQANIELRLGANVHDVRATEGGVVFTAAGRGNRADALLAADGIHSEIRQSFFGYPGATPLGQSAWRATLPIVDAGRLVEPDVVGLWLGAGGHAVHYPVGGGAQMNVVVIARGENPQPPRAPFGAELHRLMDVASDWMLTPLAEIQGRQEWSRGRVVLLGDAAHAMAPSAAQGGAQAIEDAWEISAALADATSNPAAAFEKYERRRRPRVARVARASRLNLNAYALTGVPALARNALLIASPASLLTARLDWLFGWRPR